MVSHKHLDESGLQPLNVFVLGVPMCACRASWILVLVLSRGINIMEFVLIRRRILYKKEKKKSQNCIYRLPLGVMQSNRIALLSKMFKKIYIYKSLEIFLKYIALIFFHRIEKHKCSSDSNLEKLQ